MNIVVRGLPEPKIESILSRNVMVADFLSKKLGMQGVTVFGSHQIGKKDNATNCAVVCTMLDARKRAIILENAHFYLKDTKYYISEDRTPTEQAKCQKAYVVAIKAYAISPLGCLFSYA